jgi:hypothetical protein
MKMPNSKQAIRIRWYGLRWNQIMIWWLNGCFMEMNKNYMQAKVRFPLIRQKDGGCKKNKIRGNDRLIESFSKAFRGNLIKDKNRIPYYINGNGNIT